VTLFSFVPLAAAIFSLTLAFVSLLPKKSSLATWYFFAGMAVLGFDSLFTGHFRDMLRNPQSSSAPRTPPSPSARASVAAASDSSPSPALR
jgi:hypothetical protein